jgi:hypothetical protein
MKAITSSREQNMQHMTKFSMESLTANIATNKMAVRLSTIRYLAGILCPQQLARPRRSSHARIGTFFQNGIIAPHRHLERGNTTDCPAGTLYMQTFRKLPTHAPMIKTTMKPKLII